MNKNIIYQRFKKSAKTYHQKAVAQQKIANHLFEMICSIDPPTGGELLEIGCGTGFLTEPLLNQLMPQRAILNDLCETVKSSLSHLLSDKIKFIAGDAETIDFSGNFDLIASSSTIQWFADPEQFIAKSAKKLHNDGLLAISTFGPNNLYEIRTVCGEGLSYPDIQKWISHHFRITAFETEQIVLHFDTPRDVLLHLKQTGVTGNSNSSWTRARLKTFEEKYTALFLQEKGVSLTYEPIYIIASKLNQRI